MTTTTQPKNYERGCDGWVIVHRDERHAKPGYGPLVTWWYGPNHGFGTTYGRLDWSAAVFPTRRAAEQAHRSVYGVLHHSYSAQRVSEGEREQIERWQRNYALTERPDIRKAIRKSLSEYGEKP